MWVQQLNKIGLISLNTLSTLENVADLPTKRVPRAVLNKLAGMMGYTFRDEESRKCQDYTNINQNYWDHKLAAIERLPVFDDGENESLDLHRPLRDLLSYVTVLRQCRENVGMTRTNREV